MPPSLADYEFALDEQGFILNSDFGGDPTTLPFVDVSSVTGLDSAPQRMNTNEHEGSDGTYVDASFLSMRTIAIVGILYSNVNDCDTLLTALRAAYTSPAIRPFYFQLPSQTLKFVFAQGGGAQYPVDVNRRLGQTNLQLTLLCSDPYIYDYPANFDSANYNAPVNTGLAFNAGFNLGFGAPIHYSATSVGNFGTHTGYPTITLYGPLVNPVLRDSVSNVTMKFNITLTASDILVVDCRYKKAILNGTVSRRSALQGRQWFSIPAGVQDTFFLAADSGSGSYSALCYNTYY